VIPGLGFPARPFAVPYRPRYGPELLSNLSFEEAGGGGADVFLDWAETAADGAIADEAVLVHTGGHACKITCGATLTVAGAHVAYTFPVTAGETYRLDYWTRGDGADAGRHYVYDNTNAAPIVALASTGITGTAYRHVTVDFVAPAGCASADVRFFAGGVNAAVAYFDDVSVHLLLF